MKKTVIWITGLSGAGKTTVAKSLEAKLKTENVKVGLLDGDEVRNYLVENKGRAYGFSIEERKTFVNNVIYMARNMLEFQAAEVVIVALISPLKEMRSNARDILTKYSNANFIEVYLDVPVDICEHRDPKGLYAKARAGEITNFTGIDSIYEPAVNAEVIIPFNYTVEHATEMVYNAIYEENSTSN